MLQRPSRQRLSSNALGYGSPLGSHSLRQGTRIRSPCRKFAVPTSHEEGALYVPRICSARQTPGFCPKCYSFFHHSKMGSCTL
jgi:hypothetical protein